MMDGWNNNQDISYYGQNRKNYGEKFAGELAGIAIREFGRALIEPFAIKLKKAIDEKINGSQKKRNESSPIAVNKEATNGEGVIESPEEYAQLTEGVEAVPIWNGLIYTGDIAFFIGDSGSGKSPLILQLASDLSLRNNSSLFPVTKIPPFTKVIYYDYEMSPVTWKERYPDMTIFSGMERVNSSDLLTSEDLIADFKKRISSNKGNILFIVDTLSNFGRKFMSKGAQEMLQQVKLFRDNAFKKKRQLTFIFLAHLDKKKRNKLMEKEDIFGSSIQYKLADCVIGVGKTHFDDRYKYVKLLKTRMRELPQSVSLVQSFKESPNDNLVFRYIGECDEGKLISQKTKSIEDALIVNDITDSHAECVVTIKYGKRRIPLEDAIEMKLMRTIGKQSLENIVNYLNKEHPELEIKFTMQVSRIIEHFDDYLTENNIDWNSLIQNIVLTQTQPVVDCNQTEEDDIELGDAPIHESDGNRKIDLSDFGKDTQQKKKKKRIKNKQ